MYEISMQQKENLVDEMAQVLKERDWQYSYDALRTIVDNWFSRKRNLIDLLSKHPNWVEDKYMIQFDMDFERAKDEGVIENFMRWVSDFCPQKLKYNMYFALKSYESNVISKELEEVFQKNYPELKIVEGQKTSRAVNKLCNFIGVSEHMDYNRKFAQYADAINPLKIKRHTLLSLNPIDYLLMSYGNSWNSCHNIEDGDCGDHCYCAGTLSYMLDNVSMVFYTVDASYNGNEIEQQLKIHRQMFMYEDGALHQSRLYPSSNDYGHERTYEMYRNTVQQIIADCLNKPNLWVLKSHAEEWVEEAEGNVAYPDWDYNKTFFSVLKERKEELDEGYTMKIGNYPICIVCGREFDNFTRSLSCCDQEYYCEHCGELITIDDEMTTTAGRSGCTHCIQESSISFDTYFTDEMIYINNEGLVGPDETDNYYFCEECGEWYKCVEDGQYIDSDWYCNSCAEEVGSYCQCCEELFLTEDMYELDGELYCYDCYQEELKRREEREEEDDAEQ